jgi:hypothetical protein
MTENIIYRETKDQRDPTRTLKDHIEGFADRSLKAGVPLIELTTRPEDDREALIQGAAAIIKGRTDYLLNGIQNNSSSETDSQTEQNTPQPAVEVVQNQGQEFAVLNRIYDLLKADQYLTKKKLIQILQAQFEKNNQKAQDFIEFIGRNLDLMDLKQHLKFKNFFSLIKVLTNTYGNDIEKFKLVFAKLVLIYSKEDKHTADFDKHKNLQNISFAEFEILISNEDILDNLFCFDFIYG